MIIVILSRILLRMTYISDRSCRENQNPHILYSSRTVYEIMLKEYGGDRQATDDNIIRRMLVAR